jgi:hypothetical protein
MHKKDPLSTCRQAGNRARDCGTGRLGRVGCAGGFEIGFDWVCFGFATGWEAVNWVCIGSEGGYFHNGLFQKRLRSLGLFGNWVCFV